MYTVLKCFPFESIKYDNLLTTLICRTLPPIKNMRRFFHRLKHTFAQFTKHAKYNTTIVSRKRPNWKLLFSGLTLFTFGVVVGNQQQKLHHFFPPLKQQEKLNNQNVKNILQRHMVKLGFPGCSICVIVNGELKYEDAIGYSDVENLVPMRTDSVLRIASISKALTSAAIGLLVEQGKLDLDAPIQKYLPDYPQGKEHPITTRHLCAHLSGIRHYKKGKDTEFYSQKHYNNVKSTLEVFQNESLLFPPGSKYHYTTLGYNVLSAIIESVTGEDYLTFMKKNVFQKVGMKNTCAEYHEPIVNYRARQYMRKNGQLKNAPYVDNSFKWAGGGFISSARDLAMFGSALLSGELLKPETVDLLFTPQKTSSGEEIKYGLGWYVNPPLSTKSYKIVGHSGNKAWCFAYSIQVKQWEEHRICC